MHILEPATRKAFTDLCQTMQMYEKWNVFQCRSLNLSFTATETQLFIQLQPECLRCLRAEVAFPPNDAFADMIICDRINKPDCKSEQLL